MEHHQSVVGDFTIDLEAHAAEVVRRMANWS